MKTPINCPICHGPLLSRYQAAFNSKSQRCEKSCNKTLTHRVLFVTSNFDGDLIDFIRLELSPTKGIIWYMLYKPPSVLINEGATAPRSDIYLPYFEPDFSDYKKLISKIKTYTIFS